MAIGRFRLVRNAVDRLFLLLCRSLHFKVTFRHMYVTVTVVNLDKSSVFPIAFEFWTFFIHIFVFYMLAFESFCLLLGSFRYFCFHYEET